MGIGVVEEESQGKLHAVQIIFGSEPSNQEILTWLQKAMLPLMESAIVGVTNESQERKVNPKRLARQVAKEMQELGVSTRSQQAIQLDREQKKKFINRSRSKNKKN